MFVRLTVIAMSLSTIGALALAAEPFDAIETGATANLRRYVSHHHLVRFR